MGCGIRSHRHHWHVFKHVESKKTIVAMSTHFDNAGVVSRHESAKIVQRVTAKVTHNGVLPFFLAGDLNSETSDGAYHILNNSTSILQDTNEQAKWKYGDQSTFTDFDNQVKAMIDFIFTGPRGEGNWVVQGSSVVPNRFEDGVYNSDHRAVVVDGVLVV